jgi:diguanylate cyclase (GGDEF)-like protein
MGDTERTLEQRVRELTIINDLVKTLTSTLQLTDVLRIVLDKIKTLTSAEALSLLLYDGEREELVFAATETLRENAIVGLKVPEAQSIARWVVRTGQPALVNDTGSDTRFYDAIDQVSHFATSSLLAVPLRRAGEVIGVIEVVNRYGGKWFSDEDLRKLQGVAERVGDSINPDAVIQDTEALRGLLAQVNAAVPSEGSSLLLLDNNGQELVFRASRTLQPGVVDGMRLPTSQGIAGWVARNREAVRLDDATKDARYFSGIEDRTHFRPQSMICVPMVSKGTLLGVIQVINKIGNQAFTDDELRMSQTLADHAAIAVENASLYRRAYLASMTDDLTGLWNTRHFNKSLGELVKRGGTVSLMVLDLDNFKQVVDTYGHLAGSKTIGQIGRLIGHLVRPGDIAARFGGDEFVVIFPMTDGDTAYEIAETICEAVEATGSLEGNGVDISNVTASVGVASYPEDADSADGLFRAADAAMYVAKRQGKNRVSRSSRRPRGDA